MPKKRGAQGTEGRDTEGTSQSHLGMTRVRDERGQLLMLKRRDFPKGSEHDATYYRYQSMRYAELAAEKDSRKKERLRRQLNRIRRQAEFFRSKAKECETTAKDLESQLAAVADGN